MLLTLLACAVTPPEPPSEPETPDAPEEVAPTVDRAVPTSGTRVVLLGTGTPVPDPERSGPATAVVDAERAWLVDAGPGVVRRAAQAARDHELPQLAAGRLDTVLLTHLHSDHTLGLADVILGGWVLGRETPLHLIGPPGTKALADGILAAWEEDVALRRRWRRCPWRACCSTSPRRRGAWSRTATACGSRPSRSPTGRGSTRSATASTAPTGARW
ncbi:MAG: MBL fold metallo-hydrolase [Alphaproteobacteria bacterium]|nr:MBL fold metallo-hydrolase [Alphaproteobacteria bacterium]MCB9698011.1 MBL fold metallo-hydrolase [Alphaproteobacteria bacterium]